MVKTDGLAGGIEYSDCYLVQNDARFTFGFIRKVLNNGGAAINYLELESVEWRDELWHCTLRDHVSGGFFGIRARSIVNAAGPYADRINTLLGVESNFRHIFSKGAHIIVPRIIETERVLTFFASDGRLFFMVPMGGRTSIGTTDTRVDSETAEPTSNDVQFLLDNANALLDLEQPLTKDDVIATRCGVRPLVVHKEANVGQAEWSALSRKHEIDVHGERKVVAIYGGKLTDCLNVGEEAAEIIESFGIELKRSNEWYGEEPVPEDADGKPVIGDIGEQQLRRMANEEMIIHLDDFLRRRTMLELTIGQDALRTDPNLSRIAEILFGDRATEELDRHLARNQS